VPLHAEVLEGEENGASIDAMLLTLATFQAPSGWLKVDAEANVPWRFATRTTFHAPTLALNELATANVWYRVVTDATFQPPMSALNVGRL
jgi:hypothetical protein